MSTNLPIACSLTAAELPERLAEIAAIGRASLLEVEPGDARAVLRFRADPGTRERLGAIAAAEAECCAFLAIALRDEGDQLVLTIESPPEAEPVMRELVAAFSGHLSSGRRPPCRSGSRSARPGSARETWSP